MVVSNAPAEMDGIPIFSPSVSEYVLYTMVVSNTPAEIDGRPMSRRSVSEYVLIVTSNDPAEMDGRPIFRLSSKLYGYIALVTYVILSSNSPADIVGIPIIKLSVSTEYVIKGSGNKVATTFVGAPGTVIITGTLTPTGIVDATDDTWVGDPVSSVTSKNTLGALRLLSGNVINNALYQNTKIF